ncbi:MAG TPA: hypothetical protein PKE45_01500 [Caldilineaceae bacterium]|nr:hypothetical protein [Caldilineaceae bacterium]
MCCFYTVLIFLGPRAAIIVWWLVDPVRWQTTFNTFFWPLLGFLFLPWSTLMYVLVAPMGVNGWDFLWLGLAVVADISMYLGGGYGNRDRVPGYTSA